MFLIGFVKTALCVLALNFGYSGDVCHTEHTRTRTPLTQERLLAVLDASHLRITGQHPNKKKLAVAWAHVALENGKGREVYNNNLGNIGCRTVRARWPFYRVAGHRYRVYTNTQRGADAYWRTVMKCKIAMIYFKAGRPVLAARALKDCNYYEADVTRYSRVMGSLYREAIRL